MPTRIISPPTSAAPAPRLLRDSLPGAVGMVCVGGSVAVSGLLTRAPLFTVQSLRYAVAAALLLALARLTGRAVPRPRGAEWAWLAAVAACGLVLFNVALVRGAEHAEPAVLGVAVAGAPVLLALVGPLLARARPVPAVLLAAGAVTAGAALIQGGGRTDSIGLAWAAVALACEVGFTLLAVPVLGRLGPWGVSMHACWIAAVALAGLGLTTEGPTAVLALGAPELLAAAYLAVVVTALAFVLWYSTVGALGSARAGLLTGLAPASAAAGGLLLGGPAPGPTAVAGVAVVALAPLLGLRSRPRPRG
ncbi:EamA family transporter [Pseudonocardia humida]|uniref:EamA family transporter n=1 Tax=Pseudonocardia humida TaxID=2800819 RepID=A0ABT0ZS50_9PSEU|nr:EamA family transporter [Pseudonocardia humida]MCO1653545.1 EamA family transporter [Pseudonocardia humida]